MRWILDNVAQTKKMMREGDLLFGTVDTWIIWNLTKGQKYLTDVSNASRTMLFNIQTLQWDRELLRIFRISKDCLPRAKPSVFLGNNFGLVEIAGQEIPILSICGDQTSALYGQECKKQDKPRLLMAQAVL